MGRRSRTGGGAGTRFEPPPGPRADDRGRRRLCAWSHPRLAGVRSVALFVTVDCQRGGGMNRAATVAAALSCMIGSTCEFVCKVIAMFECQWAEPDGRRQLSAPEHSAQPRPSATAHRRPLCHTAWSRSREVPGAVKSPIRTNLVTLGGPDWSCSTEVRGTELRFGVRFLIPNRTFGASRCECSMR